jgi:hypothetical protein
MLDYPELITGSKPPALVTTVSGTSVTPQVLLAVSLDNGRELARERVPALVIGPAGAGVWVSDDHGGIILRDAATLKVIADREEILRRNPPFRDLWDWRIPKPIQRKYHKHDHGVCVATPMEKTAHAFVLSPNTLLAREVPHEVIYNGECVSRDGIMTPRTNTSDLPGRRLGFIGEGAAKVLADGDSVLNPRARYLDPAFITGLASDRLATVLLSGPESVLIAHRQKGRLSGERFALSRVSVSEGRILWTDTEREEISSLLRLPAHLIVHYRTVLTKVDIVTGKRVWTYRYKP